MIIILKIFSFARPEEHFPHKQESHVEKQKSQEPSCEINRWKRVHALVSQPLFKWRVKRVMISRAWSLLLLIWWITRPIFFLLLPHLLVILIFSSLLLGLPLQLFLLIIVSLLGILIETTEARIARILRIGRVAVESVLTPVLVTEGSFGVTLLLTMSLVLMRETCKVLILLSVRILGLWVLVGGLAVAVLIHARLIILLTFLRVRKHVVSARNFFELFFSLSSVLIRMILLSKFVVLFLYVCLFSSRRNAEYFVIVYLGIEVRQLLWK